MGLGPYRIIQRIMLGWRPNVHWALQRGVTPGIIFVLVLASMLRLESLQTYAASHDGCEYVVDIRDGYLPHSPHMFHHWSGRLLALFMSPERALCLLSLIGGLLTIPALGGLVIRHGAGRLEALIACGFLAVCPVAVRFSGNQEVYALQGAVALWAMVLSCSQNQRAVLAGGFLFGIAICTHGGCVFLLPAWAWCLVSPRHGGMWFSRHVYDARPWQRIGLGVGGAMLAPLVTAFCLASIFAHSSVERPMTSWWTYLGGIAPLPQLTRTTLVELPGNLWSLIGRVENNTMGTELWFRIAFPCLTFLALWRRRSGAVFWLVYTLPYFLYEALLGFGVDPGAYVVFVAPAIAALTALGVGSLVNLLRSSRLRGATSWVTAALLCGLMIPPALRSHTAALAIVSREEFFTQPHLRAAAWMAENLSSNTYLLLHRSVKKRHQLSCYSRLRPITHRNDGFRIFRGKRGWPMNGSSFEVLRYDHLVELRRNGTGVVSLIVEPNLTPNETVPPARWRVLHELDEEVGDSVRIYILEHP